MEHVERRIEKLKNNFVKRSFNLYAKLKSKTIKKALVVLHNGFVDMTTDKAMNKISDYMQQILQ